MGHGKSRGQGRPPEEVTSEQGPEGGEQTALVAAGGSRRHGQEKRPSACSWALEGSTVATALSPAPGVGRGMLQGRGATHSWPPTTPRGVHPAGGKGLTSDLPGSPNQPQAAGSPGCSPGKELPASLPAGPPPAPGRLSSAHRGPIHSRPPRAQHPPAIPRGCYESGVNLLTGRRAGLGPGRPTPRLGRQWLLCLGCGRTRAAPGSREAAEWLHMGEGPHNWGPHCSPDNCSCGPAQLLRTLLSAPAGLLPPPSAAEAGH